MTNRSRHKTTPNMHLVFVYGTLLSGMPNHRLLEKSKLVSSNARTYGKMLSLGGFPGAYHVGYVDGTIHGEVYEVDDDTLARLDQLEGYRPNTPRNHNMYERIKVSVQMSTSGEKGDLYTQHDVYMYEYVVTNDRAKTLPDIEHGSWRRYIKKGGDTDGADSQA